MASRVANQHDVSQLAFELTAALELANYYSVLFAEPALISRARVAMRATITRAAPE